MPNLGGYLAVSYFAEHIFTDALDALWRTKWEEAHGSAEWSTGTPFGLLRAEGAVSLGKPALRFRGATNDVELHLTGACRFALTLEGNAAGGVFAEIDARVSVPIKLIPAEVLLIDKTTLDLTGVALDVAELRLTWFDGPHDGNAEPAFLSAEARAALTDEFRRRAARYLTFHIPTDRIFTAELAVMTKGNPGSIIVMPFVRVGHLRVLDGWLAVGIDATSTVGETHGDAMLIGPPPDVPPPGVTAMPQADAQNAGARLIVDAATAIVYLKANAKFALLMAAATRPNLHPDMNSIDVSLQEDTVVLTAVGTIDAPDPFPGQIPFSAEIRIRPFIARSTRTLYASIKPKVQADTPFFLDLLAGIIDFFGGDSFAQLRRANKSEMAAFFGVRIEEKVPDAPALTVRLEGRQLSVRPDFIGLFGEVAMTTTYSEPRSDPTPSVVGGVHIREHFLSLRLTNWLLMIDPTFRIRYRVRRGSNGAELVSGTTWSGTLQPFSEPIDMWDDANVLETFYTAELSVERPPGTVVAESVSKVNVIDPFDRSHPYVRWRKLHYYTPTPAGHGPQPVPILSAVHRTAIRERCKFCDDRRSRFGTPYVMQALDAVPAPEEEGLSTRLCAYCFPSP
ncbi:hypothetical protein [Sinorhizobium sp. BG8]|uniref:hypothetical protein n=1 Tax=Sinorhizobium sp. BG8 TaxID=2613773 RepID=UPI00193CBBC4|nr:hypothetical protein [Sinorhizobium sp. BG8]QRM53308.1 hypothetical protein F3Y30_01020 [Sinorhizobium sp. BG8]